MNKTLSLVLTGILALCLLAGIAGGTWAYFSDTEASSNNQLVSGTLDLKTNDADGVTRSLQATNMKPGDSVGPATIHLKNTGSLDGSTLSIAFNYTECDGTNPPAYPVNKTADETAAVIEVLTLSYGGSDLLGSVSDSNNNGYKDVQDLKNASLSGLAGIAAGATKDFIITVKLKESAGNDFQADGIDMSITFTLNQ
jgi:predicted ribosomally synthesized peptide with SipW-like signal peptide